MKVWVSVRKFEQMMCRLNIVILTSVVCVYVTHEYSLWQKLFNYDYDDVVC